MWHVVRLRRKLAELSAARAELARVAVAAERRQFARDLHDLLGLSLSAVTLKAELAARQLAEDPELAREQLMDIIELSRKAIGDVRSVAAGYQTLRLDQELRSARSVLTSVDVDVRVGGLDVELPEPQSALLATVAREGVTNVLRHSTARRCDITVSKRSGVVCLDICNDGVLREHRCGLGNGIRNLTHRVSAAGGDLIVGPDPDGTFRLRAVVPLPGQP